MSELALKVLEYGFPGLCVLILVLVSVLLYPEAKREGEPRKAIIHVMYVFMALAFSLAVLSVYLQLQAGWFVRLKEHVVFLKPGGKMDVKLECPANFEELAIDLVSRQPVEYDILKDRFWEVTLTNTSNQDNKVVVQLFCEKR